MRSFTRHFFHYYKYVMVNSTDWVIDAKLCKPRYTSPARVQYFLGEQTRQRPNSAMVPQFQASEAIFNGFYKQVAQPHFFKLEILPRKVLGQCKGGSPLPSDPGVDQAVISLLSARCFHLSILCRC